ncbi:hypothetical protein HBI56_177310 [Parastagonospora nodorum]|uniref:Uncharacterized protein n=1 Tax=Phaeosphaeria nodorum (strain SN15 / ATCC MYA-4574 / FGSC 10173) TaxID=321614 RepID=A0A7U2HY94_PHANO|nr:hypothetical protein HBH56_048000 [Parastagonospora nodorum]QRC92487.1 hypothetical protein JI435_402560 [Parastagonospora nodorum SN15]KAH3933158.1 hypothetical protein HBH54_075740 [Parastagonospora nodorum]KAH3938880.1 hypothetical protein HBH53_243850 [Parastagonospora nodorum]KAH3957277.1 hypothetical protein HBH51_227110 [Parastagonospora nodorum]
MTLEARQMCRRSVGVQSCAAQSQPSGTGRAINVPDDPSDFTSCPQEHVELAKGKVFDAQS